MSIHWQRAVPQLIKQIALSIVFGVIGICPPTLNIARAQSPSLTNTAVFAGGCFWCLQADFEHIRGVESVQTGYTGGTLPDPDYEAVQSGQSDQIEAIKVVFNPQQISYAQLLVEFWTHIDPSANNQQFCDIGPQYQTSIFFSGQDQKTQAEKSKSFLLQSHRFKQVRTQIKPLGHFYPAEQYLQDYGQKNPLRAQIYRKQCGRQHGLLSLWAPDK